MNFSSETGGAQELNLFHPNSILLKAMASVGEEK